jgi:hypothetical protein
LEKSTGDHLQVGRATAEAIILVELAELVEGTFNNNSVKADEAGNFNKSEKTDKSCCVE